MPRGMSMGGRPPAFQGDKTACGATLIASQAVATAQPTGGPIGNGDPTVSHQSVTESTGPYRGRFQVLDETTGRPIPNHPYSLQTADGQTITGSTDANGYTQWHEADAPASLQFASNSSADAARGEA
jgi:hypothetical protein